MIFDTIFNNLTDLCKDVYKKEVVFIYPKDRAGLQKQINKFLSKNPEVAVLDQTTLCLSYEEQRRYVSDVVLCHTAEKVLVITTSAVILTDAFNCQIGVWGEGLISFVRLPTFGASPSRVAALVFGVEQAIGSFSDNTMCNWMSKAWTEEDAGVLEEICRSIGNGWKPAKLCGMYDHLMEKINGTR